MSLSVRFCSTCSTARAFERVPCADGHGPECPELMCVDCGYVVIVGVVEDPTPYVPGLVRSVA